MATRTPDRRISKLRDERDRIAVERDRVEAELRDAHRAKDEIPSRKETAILARARGRGAESPEAIDKDADRLRRLISDREIEAAALLKAEREIGREIGDIFESDEGLAFYSARAHEASLHAVAAREEANAAIACAADAWREAERQWLAIRQAHIHRGEPVPKHVPSPAFNPLIDRHMEHWEPWPGGRRPDDDDDE